jgi:uncharacterized protein YjbI with pentapeptide repeats
MKKLFLLILIPFLGIAQDKINASEIIDLINSGQDVVLKQKVVIGTLDFTELNNKEKVEGKEKPRYKSVVAVKLDFENCEFEDAIIAFKNLESKEGVYGEVYTANFDQEVTFKSCVFRNDFSAKYSHFQEKVSFEASSFKEDANFKYAKFKEFAGFGNILFKEGANFKYAKFYQDADFYSNEYSAYADFKYAKFEERATFKNSIFGDYADFKYTNFAKNGVFAGVDFQADVDFKNVKGNVYQD